MTDSIAHLDRQAILTLIPHAGSMCLLDAVAHWDDTQLRCLSRTHTALDNPLRADGRLSAMHLVEYGAQAMAVHGGLLARMRGETASPGMLAGVRGLQLWVQHIDELAEPLVILAFKRLANADGWLYDFEAHSGAHKLASGRLSVIKALPADAPDRRSSQSAQTFT